MNQTLPTCARCSTSFWPNGRLEADPRTHFCDSCAPQPAEVVLSADGSYEHVTHGAHQRQPVQIVRSTLDPPPPGPRLQIEPRQLPGAAPKNQPAFPLPIPTPVLPQTLSFNCPACLAALNIERDLAIAGTTAPCPHCASMVIPPRIAPASALRPVLNSTWRPG